MHYTVYKVTNLINQKYYFGVHKTENLDDGYLGSGKYVRASINKYGRENFSKEILFDFETEEEAYLKEEALVDDVSLKDPMCMNLIKGGFGGTRYHDEETKKKQSEKGKRYKGSGNSQFGTCWINKDGQNKKIKKEDLEAWIQQGWIKGRVNTFSDEIRKKSKNKGDKNYMFGTCCITKNEQNKKVKLFDLETWIQQGWTRGSCVTEKTRQIIRDRFKGQNLSNEHKLKLTGLKRSEEAKKNISLGSHNSQIGTCWINKDGQTKKIKLFDLETWIQQGWVKGKIRRVA